MHRERGDPLAATFADYLLPARGGGLGCANPLLSRSSILIMFVNYLLTDKLIAARTICI
jgi:hypothetical protein